MAFAEDLSVFFDTNGFAVDAIYNSGAAVKVVFDAAYLEALGISGTNPVVFGKASDFIDPVGKSLAIGAESYVIRNSRPMTDGAIVTLELESV